MADARFMFCNEPCCRIKIRHEKVWRHIEEFGRVYVWVCLNCGYVIVPKVTYLSKPDGEHLEFVTKRQIEKAMAKAA